MAIFDNNGIKIYSEHDLYNFESSNGKTYLEATINDSNKCILGGWGLSFIDNNNISEITGLWNAPVYPGIPSNDSYTIDNVYCGTSSTGEQNICKVTYTYSYTGKFEDNNITFATIVDSSLYGRTQIIYKDRWYSSVSEPSVFKIIPVYASGKYDTIELVIYMPVFIYKGYYVYMKPRGLAGINVPTTLDNRTAPITAKTWKDLTWELSPHQFSEREIDSTTDTSQGGGYGTGTMPTDNIDIPALPTINMSDTGSTLYSLTALQMKNFRSWLWTTDWVDNLKKIRTDPMQNIIGISIADIPIAAGLNALIYVGNVASTIEANVISNSFFELDCGEITIDEYYGSFADYEPFIATTLYLPKVGFVQIPADVCVNNTIKVVYHIEMSSGEGLCYVQLTSKRDGFTYIWNTYTCHVTSNITLSAQDHSQQLVALSNAIINTGISASNALVNPATQGVTNTLSSCIDVATTKNPTSTKGNVGNMSAVMCYKKPYLLINRTNLTKPSSFQENNGYLINYTNTIGGHTGFLQTRNYHCSFNAPYNHRAEIERLMDGGVFINA